jgi:hypothetical protein
MNWKVDQVPLSVVLLNPSARNPLGVTVESVAVAAAVLGFRRYRIWNLSLTPTRDLPELNREGTSDAGWLQARPGLTEGLRSGRGLLVGWGLGGFSGGTRLQFSTQVHWFLSQAVVLDWRSCWTVGGLPRHPSRWRQYVGPQRGLYMGCTFEERLRRALVATPLDSPNLLAGTFRNRS